MSSDENKPREEDGLLFLWTCLLKGHCSAQFLVVGEACAMRVFIFSWSGLFLDTIF